VKLELAFQLFLPGHINHDDHDELLLLATDNIRKKESLEDDATFALYLDFKMSQFLF